MFDYSQPRWKRSSFSTRKRSEIKNKRKNFSSHMCKAIEIIEKLFILICELHCRCVKLNFIFFFLGIKWKVSCRLRGWVWEVDGRRNVINLKCNFQLFISFVKIFSLFFEYFLAIKLPHFHRFLCGSSLVYGGRF